LNLYPSVCLEEVGHLLELLLFAPAHKTDPHEEAPSKDQDDQDDTTHAPDHAVASPEGSGHANYPKHEGEEVPSEAQVDEEAVVVP
jgi:hypothetical protein